MRDKTSFASWLGQQTFGIAAAGPDAERLPLPFLSPAPRGTHGHTACGPTRGTRTAGIAHRRT